VEALQTAERELGGYSGPDNRSRLG